MSCARTQTLPPHQQGGKVAFAELVDAFGGQAKASEETGKVQSRISSYGLPNTADFPPLDVIDALEARTVGTAGHPHVTGWLARRRGYELVKAPDPSAPPMPLTTLISDLVRTSGQLSSGILDAGEQLHGGEAWRRLADADDLVRIAVQIRHELQQRATEEAPPPDGPR